MIKTGLMAGFFLFKNPTFNHVLTPIILYEKDCV